MNSCCVLKGMFCVVGKLPVFKTSEVSLIDVEKLIDLGYRFDLKEDLPDGQSFDNLERYLEDGKNRIRLCSCGEGVSANSK